MARPGIEEGGVLVEAFDVRLRRARRGRNGMPLGLRTVGRGGVCSVEEVVNR
jgi:hypothetical protein